MKLILIVFFLLPGSIFVFASEVKFSSHLQPHFHAKACTNCHEFFDKKNNGLIFKSHKGRTSEMCMMCHNQGITGFEHPEEWFARPSLYTSDMNAQQTCEAIKEALHADFKNKKLLASQLEEHLLEDPRVLWAIEGATPKSGMLPDGQKTPELVKVGMEEWKKQIKAWINNGMKCD